MYLETISYVLQMPVIVDAIYSKKADLRLVKAVEAKSWTGAPLCWLVHTVLTTSSCEGNIWKPYPVTVDVSGNHILCTVDAGTVDAIYSKKSDLALLMGC
jgi:hypothetical protein